MLGPLTGTWCRCVFCFQMGTEFRETERLTKLCSFRNSHLGWKDGPVHKSTGCSCKNPSSISKTYMVAHNCL